MYVQYVCKDAAGVALLLDPENSKFCHKIEYFSNLFGAEKFRRPLWR